MTHLVRTRRTWTAAPPLSAVQSSSVAAYARLSSQSRAILRAIHATKDVYALRELYRRLKVVNAQAETLRSQDGRKPL